jgi:murein DD-endopeptidase MepM/ murein hydrolase activator NlpD
MKKIILVTLNILAVTGCSTAFNKKGSREVSSLENSVFQCDNGSQEVVPAGNIIPVNDNLYYPIQKNIKPNIEFGSDYRSKRASHRQGVLRPHAVFESNQAQKVRAIHSGEVTSIGRWQGRTFSASVKSADGHVTRYGGLSPKSLESEKDGGTKVGDWLEAGDVFAKTISVRHSTGNNPFDKPSLYVEVYSGKLEGGLTRRNKEKCFNRREDILDTSKWLEEIKALTFDPRDI